MHSGVSAPSSTELKFFGTISSGATLTSNSSSNSPTIDHYLFHLFHVFFSHFEISRSLGTEFPGVPDSETNKCSCSHILILFKFSSCKFIKYFLDTNFLVFSIHLKKLFHLITLFLFLI